jgi:hypothetical protein
LYGVFFFFQKKKQKAFVLLRRKLHLTHDSAKPTQAGLGACLQGNNQSISLFSREKSKKRFSASQKTVGCPKLGEADPGGLGACPQGNNLSISLPFQKKRQKALTCFSEDCTVPNLRRSRSWGFGGRSFDEVDVVCDGSLGAVGYHCLFGIRKSKFCN